MTLLTTVPDQHQIYYLRCRFVVADVATDGEARLAPCDFGRLDGT